MTGTASDVFVFLTLSNATDAITGSSDAFVSLLASTISGSTDGLSDVNATVTNSTFAGNTVAISGGTVGLYDSTTSRDRNTQRPYSLALTRDQDFAADNGSAALNLGMAQRLRRTGI